MATGDKLVTLDEIKEIYKHPLVVAITSGQWSGSGSDYYITVTASNVTADSILVPTYDNASKSYLKGPVWCVPAAGSFTIHTSAIPSGTVNIMVQFPGVMGEANYQVLADVYSKSQTYSKTEAVAKADIVNNLGNNENGTYVKFLNGIMIVYAAINSFTFVKQTTSTMTKTFPEAFVGDRPAVSLLVNTTIPDKLILSTYGVTLTQYTLNGVSTFSADQNPLIFMIAIGRWK